MLSTVLHDSEQIIFDLRAMLTGQDLVVNSCTAHVFPPLLTFLVFPGNGQVSAKFQGLCHLHVIQKAIFIDEVKVL